jgi:4-amino-4-deoxy-L-arabinose transferase-like glycosyltransferase
MISVLLRVASALAMGDTVVELPGIFDQISYHNLALRVAAGHGFSFAETWWPVTAANAPTAHWSFLYTLYLSAIYDLFGAHPLLARILQAIIVGILHPYLAFRLGTRVFNLQAGLAAAAITGIYVYFIYYGAALMTEPYYMTALLLCLWLAIKLADSQGRSTEILPAFALGVCAGLAVLLRQVFLLFVPVLFLWVWLVRFRDRQSLPIVSTVLSVAIIILVILPVSFYNHSRFGRFVLLNTNSGYAFFWANHPMYGTQFVPILSTEQYRAMIPAEVRHLDEAALDQELLRRGIQFVLDDPGRYALLSLSRIPIYFMFWYSPASSTLSNISRLGSFGIFLPLMLAGVVLGIKRYARFWELVTSPVGLLLLFVLLYSAIHILTWTLIRYRLPVDAVLILFAGLAMIKAVERISLPGTRFVTR